MALSKPDYIVAANVADTEANYPWDEWNVREAYSPPDDELIDRYDGLTHRAQVAMTIATAEWIVFRFEALSDDPMPLNYLEAAWAANIDTAHGVYIETDDDEWRGPIRGPLNMAITIVADALFCADQTDDTAENPAWMSKLAERVLPPRSLAAFRTWRATCLQRLETYYTEPDEEENEDDFGDLFSEEDAGGPPVPREIFDPSFEFRPDMVATLVDRFLADLDPRANEFLQTPEEEGA
jgi:hypothetical protein